MFLLGTNALASFAGIENDKKFNSFETDSSKSATATPTVRRPMKTNAFMVDTIDNRKPEPDVIKLFTSGINKCS
jgi:hypothetical protein